MNTVDNTLHNKVHNWINMIGFQINFSETDHKKKVTTSHYFFETFNFLESAKEDTPQRSKFMCFDTYGEKLNVKTLLDIQAAFYENISQLK
jgi:hypothetical protein